MEKHVGVVGHGRFHRGVNAVVHPREIAHVWKIRKHTIIIDTIPVYNIITVKRCGLSGDDAYYTFQLTDDAINGFEGEFLAPSPHIPLDLDGFRRPNDFYKFHVRTTTPS